MKKSTQKTRVPANLNLQTTARKEGRCLSVLVPLLAALTLAVSASQVRAQITGAEYNLKLDFGAVGDGNANDSPALQAALDAMAQAGGGARRPAGPLRAGHAGQEGLPQPGIIHHGKRRRLFFAVPRQKWRRHSKPQARKSGAPRAQRAGLRWNAGGKRRCHCRTIPEPLPTGDD
jgi:hypothetical protein